MMKIGGRLRNGGTWFTHLIFSFTLLAVVLIGLVGSYLYVQANRLMVDEIARDSKQRLMTSSDFVENTVAAKIRKQYPQPCSVYLVVRESIYAELFTG